MDHITVPKVRRRDRRGWEPGIPPRCSAASPGTPSQLLECSLTPSSARDRSYIPRFTPRFTQTELSSPWDLLAGGCGTQRRGGSVPIVLLLDAASALGGSLPGPSLSCLLRSQLLLAPQRLPHTPLYSSLLYRLAALVTAFLEYPEWHCLPEGYFLYPGFPCPSLDFCPNSCSDHHSSSPTCMCGFGGKSICPAPSWAIGKRCNRVDLALLIQEKKRRGDIARPVGVCVQLTLVRASFMSFLSRYYSVFPQLQPLSFRIHFLPVRFLSTVRLRTGKGYN